MDPWIRLIVWANLPDIIMRIDLQKHRALRSRRLPHARTMLLCTLATPRDPRPGTGQETSLRSTDTDADVEEIGPDSRALNL